MVDEEALSKHLSPERRKVTGAFFTPSGLVRQVLDLVAPFVPRAALSVVDPACGAGAFLVAAAERWPRAALFGAELDPTSARLARARVPGATIVEGNALTDPSLDERVGTPGFELWLGNPPYNGTSPLLKDRAAWDRVRRWLPLALPKHTSLREDYVFFLLRAARRLAGRKGALAFITSATLLDTFTYAPVRQQLLGQLSLREVVDLGVGAFTNTQVRTCVTVWTTAKGPARFAGVDFTPRAPEFALRPALASADALDADWRARGASVTELIPVSFPGLKTRFDELLVDDDAKRLLERVRAFCRCSPSELPAFARRFELAPALLPKLRALRGSFSSLAVSRSQVRRFVRYRGELPSGPPGFCYLERQLIPRGDHRLRGDYDPHAAEVKLVFNQLELPLWAQVLEGDQCITAYRHARFAPLSVPVALLADPACRTLDPRGPVAPNLSPLGLAWAKALGSPRAVFDHVAAHLRSEAFQTVWAPAFGRTRVPLVPLPDAIGSTRALQLPFAFDDSLALPQKTTAQRRPTT